MRWKKEEGLPVHYIKHLNGTSVYAVPSELDAWWTSREKQRSETPATEPPAPEEIRAMPEANGRSLANRPSLRALKTTLAVVSGLGLMVILQRTGLLEIGAAAEKPATPRPLANDAADETCPSLAPDGNHVVYRWRREHDAGLYIKRTGGGAPIRLITDAAGDLFECGYAKWSPSGDLIAFLTEGTSGTQDVWLIAPSGGQPRRLTAMTGIGMCWTPNGETLAFVDRNSSGEPFSIFSIGLRERQRKRLTHPPLGTFGDTHCSFSPDGGRLAVARYGYRYQSDVFVIPLDAVDRHLDRLTTAFSGIEGIEWAPQGDVIVFGSHQGLWKISTVGGRREPTQFAAFEGEAKLPTIARSPSGRSYRLAYSFQLTDFNVWRWDAASRQATQITRATRWDDFPSVAPRGDRLAFASNQTGANEIWTSRIDGSAPRQVTQHDGPVVASPNWSPDGAHIAFTSQLKENRDVWIMRSDGSASERITTQPSQESNPSWSHDGRWLYFSSDEGGINQLWKVASQGGTPIRVTNGEASEAFESPDSQRLYFVRSPDVPGLWSVPANGGRETFVIPDVREGYWGVADHGVYFLAPGANGMTALKFFDFRLSTVSDLASPAVPWARLTPGFSVSRDGRYVFWTQRDHAVRDLMLIDPWQP
jgi:Tol biopolymer transport system component